MSTMINSIIENNQSVFIPWRVFHNNILMAQELVRGYGRKHTSPRCMIQMHLKKAYDTIEWNALKDVLR